jgi:hypothetical protein
MRLPGSVDSKGLVELLSSLDATLTKNRGRVGGLRKIFNFIFLL